MTRVTQTKFGPIEGNCLEACIASLLEVPIEEVVLDMTPDSDKWFHSLQAYLKPKNMFFLEVRLDVAKNYPLYEMHGVYCLMSGKSPRTFEGHPDVKHAIVGRIDSLLGEPLVFVPIHDPHPDGTFLKPDSIWGLGFFMALDPSKPTNPKA